MRIPAPTTAVMSAAEITQYRADMAILASDPRTANGANRPAYLVARVLSDARKAVR